MTLEAMPANGFDLAEMLFSITSPPQTSVQVEAKPTKGRRQCIAHIIWTIAQNGTTMVDNAVERDSCDDRAHPPDLDSAPRDLSRAFEFWCASDVAVREPVRHAHRQVKLLRTQARAAGSRKLPVLREEVIVGA